MHFLVLFTLQNQIMKRYIPLLASAIIFTSCGENKNAQATSNIDTVLNQYWEERLQLFPTEATSIGDNRYNDKLTITISKSFRDSLKNFYVKYLDRIQHIDTSKLDDNQRLSYQLFKYEMQMSIEGLTYPTHLFPISQFWSFTLELPQMGSGSGNQPFKNTKDYKDWLKRLSVFPSWVDTAIANMREGIAQKVVLPHALVEKIIPQLNGVIVTNDTESIFYGPIKAMPKDISKEDVATLAQDYKKAINTIVNPSYKKLADFFEKEYLPASRNTSGIKDIPNGEQYYNYCIRYWTTTNLSADSIYNIGLHEVARIEAEMNKVKDQVGFKGDLQAFFKSVDKNPKLYPFTTPQQVIDSFWAIKRLEDPKLKLMFSDTPKTKFTIRQTEAFRAASASAEYNQGSADGSRPGIFYTPILDAKKFSAVGMTTLFLHEAIPGHHYQISLQQENKSLPTFRRFLWYGAYGEGWAHYCETLGTGLGVYNDPYQYFGHLSDAMHRAIRLVVDVGMHSKGMTREEAIKYMMQHELITDHDATAEIERYMAIPGQALSYKIGQMAISGERAYYEKQMGSKFNIASFHTEVLKDGCVPLQVLHTKLEKWSKK